MKRALQVQGSGRNWKEPSQRASSVKNPILTSTWERKMQDKAARQHFKEVKQVAIDARKQKLQVCVCRLCSAEAKPSMPCPKPQHAIQTYVLRYLI